MLECQHLGLEPKFGLAASEANVEEEADQGVEEGRRRLRRSLAGSGPRLAHSKLGTRVHVRSGGCRRSG
jgi:hypothetical protein